MSGIDKEIIELCRKYFSHNAGIANALHHLTDEWLHGRITIKGAQHYISEITEQIDHSYN